MNFNEEEVMIDGQVKIGTTITYPNMVKKNPAIVIIMGTGKLDRDGNGLGAHWDLYKNMAAMFAEWGYVSLRYDKRGTHKSGGDFNTAGLDDLVNDAISVIEYAKSLEYVDENNVFVFGHSEGSMIATILSKKEDVAGLILAGGAATCLREALHYQQMLVDREANETKGLKGMLLRKTASAEKSNAKTEAIFQKCNDTDGDSVRISGMKMSAKWFRDHDSYTSDDFADMIKTFGKPVLAITGTADIHMDYHRLDILKDCEKIKVYTPENVNHILREIDDDNKITNVKKQYARLASRPMHQETQDTIHCWLTSISGI